MVSLLTNDKDGSGKVERRKSLSALSSLSPSLYFKVSTDLLVTGSSGGQRRAMRGPELASTHPKESIFRKFRGGQDVPVRFASCKKWGQ